MEMLYKIAESECFPQFLYENSICFILYGNAI